MKQKIITIIGARPQFVKAAVISRLLQKRDDVEEILVHTGQHFDHNMSDIFFEEMEIPRPKYNLSINGLGHGAMTGQMLEKIEEVLMKEKPDWVIVYGDTNSTIAGALAAKKLQIRVAHIEAGLRSFNMQMPEEVNRILTDRISDVLFAPTQAAVDNLMNEGYDSIDAKIERSGDVMQDAALYYAHHRAENTDDPERLHSIVEALNKIHESTRIVMPLHPRTAKLLDKYGFKLKIDLIDPVGYFDMIELLKNCSLVMTDSGGLQKEAYFFEKNCVTLRDETEWVELVANGANKLAGADGALIQKFALEMLNKTSDFSTKLYGDGRSGEQIVDVVLNF
jgi:UDP-GlcNAc3NAcA epimerase